MILAEWRISGPLHESTSPRAIAAAQREEVREFFAARPRATSEEASESLCLPVWSVEVRVAELEGRPTPYRCAKRLSP